MRLNRKSSYPIGLDVGLHGARMLQLEVVGGSPRVAAAARCVWPEELRVRFDEDRTVRPQLIAPMLHRMATQGQFQGREIVCSLPRDLVQVKNLRLPPMPLDDLVQAAQSEALAMFGVGEGDAQVQVIPAGEVRSGSETKCEVIAVCARSADVDGLVEAWHHAGFIPVAIDFEPAAIYRTIERFVRRRDDEAEVNVLVDIGLRRTTVLIGRGREFSFHKAIDIGGAMLNHAVSRKLGISVGDAITLRQRLADTHGSVHGGTPRTAGTDPVRQAVIDGVRPIAEEVAREIALCLRYYSVNFRGQRPSRVRIVGGESSDPSLLQLVGNALPVPVDAATPIANADLSSMKAADRGGALGEWTHAFGLALKFTQGGFADLQGIARAQQMERAASEAAADVASTASATPAAEVVHA